MPLCALAQSTMTDEQVMQFVVEENQSGTSQAQIVTKLMQNGVDIDQIRRVRQKYERLAKNKGLGTVGANEGTSDTRLRSNNGKNRRSNASQTDVSDGTQPSYRLKDTRDNGMAGLKFTTRPTRTGL